MHLNVTPHSTRKSYGFPSDHVSKILPDIMEAPRYTNQSTALVHWSVGWHPGNKDDRHLQGVQESILQQQGHHLPWEEGLC